MAGENTTLVRNLGDWRFSQYPKYILLPIDENQIRSNIRNVVFSEAAPRPLERNLRLVVASTDALIDILDMDPDITTTDEFVDFIAARKLPYGALPVAHRYGGHQYGMWIGQLGDGRAHIIGEFVNKLGERWQLQLKGSGQTPYARTNDGRAVLRSSIREMIAAESCYSLGIPTTRTAALVVSDDSVVRDEYYNGNPRREHAAILLRMSPCWFRFGTLEIFAYNGEIQLLRQICDFVIKEHYPNIPLGDDNRFIALFNEIAHRNLDMVSKWQGRIDCFPNDGIREECGVKDDVVTMIKKSNTLRWLKVGHIERIKKEMLAEEYLGLGFTHGLLNTDNMSLLGLTVDYGPFGFVDSYDGGYVANCSDGEGRYALAKQPDVVLWNISQLANAIKPLLTASQQLHITHIMKTLDTYLKKKILETFLMKIGLKEDRWGDEQLVEKLLDMMQQTGADFTATYRQLAELEPQEMACSANLEQKWSLKRLASHSSWGCWLDQYRARLEKEAVDASSAGLFEDERRKRMLSVNPVYVPRNWMLHEAIVDAEKDDFEKVHFLLDVMKNPYDIQPEAERRGFSSQPPQWAYALKVSCSS